MGLMLAKKKENKNIAEILTVLILEDNVFFAFKGQVNGLYELKLLFIHIFNANNVSKYHYAKRAVRRRFAKF